MDRAYYVIDAFSSKPGLGNPAAVVFDAEGLDDERMQQIATRFGLSETTFVFKAENGGASADLKATGGTAPCASVRFRWFTPAAEVDLCGHATIAGLQALFESGRLDRWRDDPAIQVRIATRSGDLAGFVEKVPAEAAGRMLWLTLPPSQLSPVTVDRPALAAALGGDQEAFCTIPPPARTRDDDVIVFVRDVATLNAFTPRFHPLAALLGAWNARGLSVATTATLTPSVHVQSRFFAPNLGINEDPVTGSVTGPLAIHLIEQGVVALEDGKAAVVCVQGIPGGRTGLVYALVEQAPEGGRWTVRIGGRAVVTESGTVDEVAAAIRPNHRHAARSAR